jgi:hypothetical protein
MRGFLSTGPSLAEEQEGRISAGTDGRLAYQHIIGRGFFLGTEIYYEELGQANSGNWMHWNQSPSIWLMTVDHQFEYKLFRANNTLRYLGILDSTGIPSY